MSERGPRLGRGLAELWGEGESPGVAVQSAIPTSLIDPDPRQPRGPIDPAHLDDLVTTIREHGILQPILVRRLASDPSRYQIVAGERRWRAAVRADLETVPCIVRDLTDRQAATASLVENLQRIDLNAWEEAQGFDRLLSEFALTHDELGQMIGKSRSHVANTLRLLKLPMELQDMLRSGTLSAGHARALLSHSDPVAAAETVVKHNLSVRQAEALSQPPKIRDGAMAPSVNPDLEMLARELSERLGIIASLRVAGQRGSLNLKFSSLDQLDKLLELLGHIPKL